MKGRSLVYERLLYIGKTKSLKSLPERIKTAIIARAKEIDYPIEATLEMAIVSFLDTEAISFADCKPNRRY